MSDQFSSLVNLEDVGRPHSFELQPMTIIRCPPDIQTCVAFGRAVGRGRLHGLGKMRTPVGIHLDRWATGDQAGLDLGGYLLVGSYCSRPWWDYTIAMTIITWKSIGWRGFDSHDGLGFDDMIEDLLAQFSGEGEETRRLSVCGVRDRVSTLFTLERTCGSH